MKYRTIHIYMKVSLCATPFKSRFKTFQEEWLHRANLTSLNPLHYVAYTNKRRNDCRLSKYDWYILLLLILYCNIINTRGLLIIFPQFTLTYTEMITHFMNTWNYQCLIPFTVIFENGNKNLLYLTKIYIFHSEVQI